MPLLSPGWPWLALAALSGLLASSSPGCPPRGSVRDLAHRAGVVFEGRLYEELRGDMNERERQRKKQRETLNRSVEAEVELNETVEAPRKHVRVRVHQVWEVKAAGLERDAVVSLVWREEDECFRPSAGTRYVFFMEATNDSAVFRALSPPVETRRAVRKDVGKVLGPSCAVPKLKALKNITVPEGQKTILKCELLAGGKRTKIEWYLNEKKISNNPTRKIKKKKRLSELTLMKAAESDAGKYTCKAINDQGEDSWDAAVTVIKAATSTTPSAKTSSHVTPCSEEERTYCVNGGECFTLEVTPNSIKRLCRCPNDFTGDRCQTYVTPSFYKHHGIEFMEAEELYQKRVLTITGICIALLVVGIMCVVAYCKTKKQRKKLHDRLRQSLRERNAMASMANGPLYPQNSHPPPENLQLVNYAMKNALPTEHVIEKETETSFSTSQYTSSTQPPTAVTHTSSQSWSNGKTDSIVSDTRAVLVMLPVQNSRNVTPTQRGRLNATGGAREPGPYLKNSRETVDSYKDSPYSERYASTMTTPTRLSPVKLLSPATPSSPPSEMSAPLSSLATSVPSMATSPSGEEERPLLFLTPPRLREKAGQEPSLSQHLRNSAHYNHGLESPSPPPSPLHITEDDQYESTQECNSTPAAASASDPHSPAASQSSKRTKSTAQASQPEQEPVSGGSSEGCSLESETEDERVGEDTPFLSIQNPGATGMGPISLDGSDSSRTNPALRLSPQDDLQTRLASVMANQNPIAV